MSDVETQKRDRLLDKVKAEIFEGNNSAFFGPLMASLNFVWTDQIETSATDYESIFWNPEDFDRLTHSERVASLLHEIAHNYRLHGLRQGQRDQQIWNLACDIVNNRGLNDSGYDVLGQWFVGQHPEITAEVEEDIYDEIMKQVPPPPPPMPMGGGQGQPDPNGAAGNKPQLGPTAASGLPRTCSCHEMGPITKAKAQKALQNVVQAASQAKLSGQPGDIPGDVEKLYNTFLKPKIPWEQHIQQWLTDHLNTRLSYQRPNRRYQAHGMLIKTRFPDEGALKHLVWAFDVSGSVTDEMIDRFNSEMKYVKDTYHPTRMTLLLFDTKIQKVVTIEKDDDYKELQVTGRGGTSLTCVRKYLTDNKATAALIFSDLECVPMQKMDIPIIWVCIGNPSATVKSGKLIHISDRDVV